MEKKIIVIMTALVLAAVLVVALVMIAAGGGLRSSGGFTALFDKLEYNGNATHEQNLQVPEGWNVNDKKTVSDTIVDMTYRKQTVSQTTVYISTLWFVYLGTKWSNPYQGEGDFFNVPDNSHDGWLSVDHGMFSIEVSSATNLSSDYSIGDVITLENALERNGNNQIGFGDWSVRNVI